MLAYDRHGLPHLDPSPEDILYDEMKPPPEDDDWLEVTDWRGRVIRRALLHRMERVVFGRDGWPRHGQHYDIKPEPLVPVGRTVWINQPRKPSERPAPKPPQWERGGIV